MCAWKGKIGHIYNAWCDKPSTLYVHYFVYATFSTHIKWTEMIVKKEEEEKENKKRI